jgi:hypothetical protein
MTKKIDDTVDCEEDPALDVDKQKSLARKMENRDSISGEPEAHSVSVGVGVALAGAAAGAAAGMVAGPVGAIVGTLVGGIAGGLAGKEVAEQMNPTQLTEYWELEYPKAEYFNESVSYADFDAAYRYGYQARFQFAGEAWSDIHDRLAIGWPNYSEGTSVLDWSEVKRAAQDGYERDYSTGCGCGTGATC